MLTVPAKSEEVLAEVFADLARQLQTEKSPDQTQERVTRSAVETVDGCDHASITMVRRRGGGVETRAATDEVPVRVDAIQYETGQGPCLEAIAEHRSCLISDLATDERWPAFCHRAAAETGVRAMLSFRLFVADDTIGALNLFSRKVAAFDESARLIGTVLAAHAAIAVTAARDREHAEHVDEALLNSREIGMAMGLLMARGPATQQQAFDLLRLTSQRLNIKLRTVAATVIDTGRLPR